MAEIIIIAHNIRSTHNVGAIFRTSEGFGVKKIILSGYTPYPKLKIDSRLPHIYEKLTSQIHKTALGAEGMVPFEYLELPPFVALKKLGYHPEYHLLKGKKHKPMITQFLNSYNPHYKEILQFMRSDEYIRLTAKDSAANRRGSARYRRRATQSL